MRYTDNSPPRLRKVVLFIERTIIKTLIALMSILLVLATVELGHVLIKAIANSGEDHFIIDLDNLMNVFGVFLLVVIGIELLDTIKVYFRKHVIHVEVVMLVAIIAVARKIIVMDFDAYSDTAILGIAATLLALASGYYLIKKTGGCGFYPRESGEQEEVVVKETIREKDGRLVERKKTINKKSEETPVAGKSNTSESSVLRDPKSMDEEAGRYSGA